MAGIVLASILLLGTNYLSYAVLYAVLACDYLIFGQRERRLSLRQWIMLLAPQILVGAVTIWIYNPLGIDLVPNLPVQNFFLEKITIIWRNFRDLNNCEFCVGMVMLAGLPVYYFTRNVLLLRGLIAVVCYCIIAAIISPQSIALSRIADVRYLAPLLPLLIGISTLVIVSLAGRRWYFAIPLSIAVFGFNVLNYPFTPSYWCSRPAEFIGELCRPRDTSISLAAKWIEDHVHEGESIWITPNMFEPSLMYHVPQPLYAWHLLYPPKEQFASLPSIHFFSPRPTPDYFIVFGPQKKSSIQCLNK